MFVCEREEEDTSKRNEKSATKQREREKSVEQMLVREIKVNRLKKTFSLLFFFLPFCMCPKRLHGTWNFSTLLNRSALLLPDVDKQKRKKVRLEKLINNSCFDENLRITLGSSQGTVSYYSRWNANRQCRLVNIVLPVRQDVGDGRSGHVVRIH